MGFWQDLTGKTGADAAKNAAADQYSKQTGAASGVRAAGDTYKTDSYANANEFDPYIQTGGEANSALARLLQDPSSLRSLPGYQFAQDEGGRAIDHSAASRGMDQSGRTLKDLTRFGQGNADSFLGNWFARLMQGTQLGDAATGQKVGVQQQGENGWLDSRKVAGNMDYGSAGTIGQGDIAAATSRTQGSQNLLNTGIKVAGMALGAAGGMPGMGGSGSSYLGAMMSPSGSNPFNPDGSRNTWAYGNG